MLLSTLNLKQADTPAEALITPRDNVNLEEMANKLASPNGMQEFYKKELIRKKTLLSALITIHGNTYSKKLVQEMKDYFDSIDQGRKGFITNEDYEDALSKQPHLKRIAGSLFLRLDKKKNGSICFREFLEATIPGAIPQQIDLMLSWVKKKSILREEDYYPSTKKPTVKLMQEDSLFEFQKMYDLYNTSKSGLLTINEFKEAFKNAFNEEDMKNVIIKYNLGGKKYITIEHFIHIFKPLDVLIPTNELDRVKAKYKTKYFSYESQKNNEEQAL